MRLSSASPLDEIAYCTSQRNVDTISIECCHPDAEGQFTQATYDSLLRLVHWLQEEYRLSSDQVIRHYDATGKECPLYYVEHPEAGVNSWTTWTPIRTPRKSNGLYTLYCPTYGTLCLVC